MVVGGAKRSLNLIDKGAGREDLNSGGVFAYK